MIPTQALIKRHLVFFLMARGGSNLEVFILPYASHLLIPWEIHLTPTYRAAMTILESSL